MRLVSVALVLAAFIAVPLPAAAQPGLVRFGLAGGVSVPVNHVKDTLKNGYVLQAFVGAYFPGTPFGVKAAVNYQKFDGKEAITTSAGGTGTGTLVSGLANMQFFLVHRGFVQPYVSLGLGGYSVGSTTTVDGVESTDHSLHFGVNAAAGAEFRFSSAVSGFIEGRLENVYTERGFSDEVKDAKNIRIVPVLFGVIF